jgi:crotonobetainyl-CoA:carnitine CoA-transferase CaiB-like acyl-CoA transferase
VCSDQDDSSSAAQSPLSGLKVVELARVLAGPWIGQTLADLGADVIKVESPQGDDTRRWGPPFVETDDGQEPQAAYFQSCNRGKRSVVADLRTQEGQAIVTALLASADVVIENFKVGGLEKYGLSYKHAQRINPRVVWCSITGFGQDGPYAYRPGYDLLAQAMSGLMDLTGEPDRQPQKIGVALVDILTGLYGAIAIQAALRQRDATGTGQQIDMALLDVGVGVLANQAANYLVSGATPRRMGNRHPNIAPYQVFPTEDGDVIVAPGNDSQFAALCRVLGLSGLANDVRFRTNSERLVHRDALTDILQQQTVGFRRDLLVQELNAAGVPAGPINSVAEVLSDPQVIHRKMVLEQDDPTLRGGVARTLRTPITFMGTPLAAGRPPPRHGQHTKEILEELGLNS